MKKFALLCAVVCLSVGASFAQSDPLRTVDSVSVVVTPSSLTTAPFPMPQPSDGVKIGPNTVCVTASHYDVAHVKYVPFYHECNHNLKTTAGIDAMIAQVGTTSTQPAAFIYLALSSDATSPASGDTTVASEITTNGLGRHIATYAHTGGTATWTETYTWTATGTVSNVQKAGLLNASSSGTLGFENTFSPVTLNSSDQLQLTWTITAS